MPPKRSAVVFQVVQSGDHNLLQQMLAKDKALLQERNDSKETPLHVACKNCFFLCVEVLLKFGASPNAQDREGRTPLHVALAFGPSQMLPMLLHHGANPALTDTHCRNALHVATANAMPKAVEMLLVDTDDADREPCPCCWQNVDADSLARRPHAHPARASRRVALDPVALVRQEDQARNTPLHFATSNPECAPVALQYLDILRDNENDALSVSIINARNKAGYVALQYAAYTGMAEVVEVLVEMGCEADILTKTGETVLHLAAEAGDLDTTNTILNVLGDRMKDKGWAEFLNRRDEAGCAALHYACLGGHLSCVRALLRHSDVLTIDLLDGRGYTPLAQAKLRGFPQLGFLLEASDADGKKAKAVMKEKPGGAAELAEFWAQRQERTLVGPTGKAVVRAEPKGEGAISKKSYLMTWAVVIALVAICAHYAYANFNEFLSNYDTEEYKRQARVAWAFVVQYTVLGAHHARRLGGVAAAKAAGWWQGAPAN